jgi:hypothetical protein
MRCCAIRTHRGRHHRSRPRGGPGFVLRDSDAVLPGGAATEILVRRRDVDTELVCAITDSGLSKSNIAVIMGTRKDAAHYQRCWSGPGLRPCRWRSTTALGLS